MAELFEAILQRDMYTIYRLIQVENHPGDTLLPILAEYSLPRVATFVIERGADIHYGDDLSFRIAADWGYERMKDIDIVNVFIQAGANVNANNGEALRTAILKNFDEVVEVLLQAGANIYEPDSELLISASAFDFLPVVARLLQLGADVHANNDEALRLASRSGNEEIVELLLHAGADVHANNNEALRSAVEKDDTEVIELLLEYCAQPIDDETRQLSGTLNMKDMVMYQALGESYLQSIPRCRQNRVRSLRRRLK